MDKRKILIIVIALVVIFVVYLVISLNNKKVSDNAINQTGNKNITSQTNQTNTQNTISKNEDSSISVEPGVIINKKDITTIAKFYDYKSGNINIEVMAVKDSNGSIRTAFNTCQVCYDSGRGYYKQEGDYMVCQNCGNKFNIDQIEKVKGGCNPVPILEKDKTDNGDTILISREYLDSQKTYFENWK